MIPLFLAVLACSRGNQVQADETNFVSGTLVCEVAATQPKPFIMHGLELKSTLDAERQWANLRGPRYFSRDIICNGQAPKQSDVYSSWYQIAKPAPSKPQSVKVASPVEPGQSLKIEFGSPKFLLSPAQVLASGPPSALPEDLNLFRLHEVLSDHPLDQQVTVESDWQKSTGLLGKLLYVGLPCEQWHHDEVAPVKDAEKVRLVFEFQSSDYNKSASILDQFGINSLQLESAKLLMIETALLRQ